MEILIQSFVFVLIGVVVYGLGRLLRLKPVYPVIVSPKRSALCSLVAVSASVLTIFALMLAFGTHGPTHIHTGMAHKQQRHVVDQLFLQLV
jgi:hypothetical protein